MDCYRHLGSNRTGYHCSVRSQKNCFALEASIKILGKEGVFMTALLSSATELLTWFITSMGSLITFILGQPAILMMFLILLVGSVVGMLFRVWHSA